MAAFDSFRDKWESISPRERRLVVLLGVSAVVVLVLYVALGIKDKLDALETKNASARLALQKLTAYKAAAKPVAGGSDPAAAITTEPVKLESYIYKAGETASVVVPGVNPRTPEKRGKYVVHAAQVDIRDLTLVQVKDFLQALEGESRVVMVTSLRLNRNFRDGEKMDLSAEISTYSMMAENGAGSGSGSGSDTGSAKGGQ
jgi:type II secretory pathway component PulM